MKTTDTWYVPWTALPDPFKGYVFCEQEHPESGLSYIIVGTTEAAARRALPQAAYVDTKTTEQLMDLVKDKEIYVGLGVYGAEGEFDFVEFPEKGEAC